MDELKLNDRPFEISKWLVWEAWPKVKANKGAAGVDEESIEEFERDLSGNLYKLWNRLSSGSCMPPPVRAVEIPKRGGGSRMLGVPTVADRVAQTVVRLLLEPEVEPLLHPDKTRIVYCKDSNRKGSDEHERFDFLGYTFRPRSAVDRSGVLFVSFCPAISGDAAKAIRRTIRRRRLHLQGSLSLTDLARKVNPIVRGRINYHGRFYPTELLRSLDRVNRCLMRSAMRKYKRLPRHPKVAWKLVASVRKRRPGLFAHWQAGATPTAG